MKRPRAEHPYLLTIMVILLAPHAFAECYLPNGTLETDPAYQPCAGFNGTARMCCATNRTNPFGGADTDGWTANKCLPNGLCMDGFTTINSHGETVMAEQYWRDLCTSQNWNEGGCLNACATVAYNQTIQLTPCGNPNTSTTWCCGATTDCCNSSNAEYIPATLQGYIATLTTTSSTTQSTATSSSVGTSTSASNQAPPQSSSGISTAAKTGIGIGVGAGAIVFLAGLAWILLKKKRSKSTSEEELRPFNAGNKTPKELANTEVASELPSHSSTWVQELHGDSVKK